MCAHTKKNSRLFATAKKLPFQAAVFKQCFKALFNSSEGACQLRRHLQAFAHSARQYDDVRTAMGGVDDGDRSAAGIADLTMPR